MTRTGPTRLDTAARVYLTDFGLAKSVATGSKLTRTGQALGTPAYMSPEQARSESAGLTRATDVWSLGCVLHEMLTGQPAFAGETPAAVIARVLMQEPPDVRRGHPDVPADLVRVLRASVAKPVRDRHPDAGAFRDDLDRILRGQRPRARDPRAARRRGVAAGAAVALAGTGLLVAALGRGLRETEPQRPVAPREDENADALRRARALRARDPAGAAALLAASGAAPGASREIRLLRAECLRESAQWREAEAEYGRLVEEAPDVRETRFGRGLSRWLGREAGVRDLPGPREDLTLAAGIADGRAALARAVLAWMDRRWAEATREMASAGGDWESHLVRGLLRHHAGEASPEDQAAAVRDFTRVLESGPPLAWIFHERGHAQMLAGDLPGAEADFGEEIGRRPGDAEGWIHRAIARRERGDFAGAVEDFTRAIALRPEDAAVRADRGSCKARAGDHAGAVQDCTEALRIDPQGALALATRGDARARLGDPEGGLADCAEAIRLRPADPQGFSNRGNVRLALGDVPGALEDYAEAIRFSPRDPVLHYNRGNIRFQSQDFGGAVEDYGNALALRPDYPEALTNRGFVFCALREPARGAGDARAALAVRPGFADARFVLGIALRDQGDWAGAVEALRQFLAEAPGHPRARKARGDLAHCEARLKDRG